MAYGEEFKSTVSELRQSRTDGQKRLKTHGWFIGIAVIALVLCVQFDVEPFWQAMALVYFLMVLGDNFKMQNQLMMIQSELNQAFIIKELTEDMGRELKEYIYEQTHPKESRRYDLD